MGGVQQPMLILTRQPDTYAVRRLLAAAAAQSQPLVAVDPHRFYLYTLQGRAQARLPELPDLTLAQLKLLPRLGSLATEYALAALEHLERCGARAFNRAAALLQLRHKFGALTQLAQAGLPVPDSIMLRSPNEIADAAQRLGGYPLVLKFIRGSQGVGVVYAADESVARSVLEALNLVQYDVLMQRYYPAAAHSDLRVLVLGGEARWAVRRQSSAGRFRANFHLGGSASAADLSADLAQLAQRAAACFGLDMAGVDLVDSGAGLMVLEVNGSPGFEAIEQACGVDVAGEIMTRLAAW